MVTCNICEDGTLCNCAVSRNLGNTYAFACACIGFLGCPECGLRPEWFELIHFLSDEEEERERQRISENRAKFFNPK